MTTNPYASKDPFKLGTLYLFALKDSSFLATVKSQNLHDVHTALVSSILRLRSQILYPAILGDFAMRVQRFSSIAELEISGELRKHEHSNHPRQTEIAERVIHLFGDTQMEIRTFKKSPSEWDEWIIGRIEAGATPSMLISQLPMGADGVKAYLASLVTATWTLFEALTGDLWEAALNFHPNTLAALSGARKRIIRKSTDSDASDEGEDAATKDARTVPLHDMLRHEFKIHDKMGAVLRTRRRFDSLRGIREAYALAFSKKYESIDTILAQKTLDSLAAVRNLIVHRASIVDETYIAKSKHLSVPIAPIGEQITFDGNGIASLIAPVVAAGIALFAAVDEWITTN